MSELKKVSRRFEIKNSQLFLSNEKGISIIPAQAFHKYWRRPDKENVISDYEKDDGRSAELVKLFSKYCSKDNRILEPGCSVGRNLHYLYEAGFTNLKGVEINQEAIFRGDKLYPNTVAKIPRWCSSFEDYLVDCVDNPADVVFTMAFFMHVHPSSEWIFQVIYNRIRKFVITVENEEGLNYRVISRKYKDIFEGFGMKQLEEKYLEFDNTIDSTGTIKLTYRVFKK